MTLPQSKTSNREQSAPFAADPHWAIYADGIRLIALRALGDATLAEDIAHESIARAISALTKDRASPIGDLGAFVYGIAKHLIADVHRAHGRTVSLDTVAEAVEPRDDALTAAVAADERARLREALARLSNSDRDVLHLSFFEGLTPEQIAQRLGDDAVRVRKRKSRALRRLREAFFGVRTLSR